MDSRGWKNEKKKKNTKHVSKETFHRQWEETVVGLKMHIHRKRLQASRKHYLLQVRGAGVWLISGCFTPLKTF